MLSLESPRLVILLVLGLYSGIFLATEMYSAKKRKGNKFQKSSTDGNMSSWLLPVRLAVMGEDSQWGSA